MTIFRQRNASASKKHQYQNNPAYVRHLLSQCVQIRAPIQNRRNKNLVSSHRYTGFSISHTLTTECGLYPKSIWRFYPTSMGLQKKRLDRLYFKSLSFVVFCSIQQNPKRPNKTQHILKM